MNDKELIETLHYCQNNLLKVKEVLEEMRLWEEVKKQIEK